MILLGTRQIYNEGSDKYCLCGLVRQQGEFDTWFFFYKNLKTSEIDTKESDLLEMSEEELNEKFNYDELEECLC